MVELVRSGRNPEERRVWILVIGTNVYWLIHFIQKTTAGRS